ncbi:CoA transferase, partial [Bacillus sp. WP8]|uniref:CoA transferase n=1 Tax=Bacillus sp. WP8 TaxID=756828 RepID=UPI0016435800
PTYHTNHPHYFLLLTTTHSTFNPFPHPINPLHLLHNQKFPLNPSTLNHNKQIHPILSPSIPSKTTDHLLQILHTHPLPLTPILTIPDIFEHPQFKATQN